jgi:hypothetical protein
MGNLTATEKQIAGAAAAVVILSLYALIARWGGFMFVTLLASAAALVILFLPQIAPNTKAPGSKGSLLMVSGVLAALFWLLAVLYWLSYIFSNVNLDTILFLVGFAASLYLGWLCWQAFQAEGGKFQFGNTDMGTTSSSAGGSAPPPAEPAAAPPPAAPPPAAPPPAAPPPAAPPPASPASPSADTGMGAPPSPAGGDEENRV